MPDLLAAQHAGQMVRDALVEAGIDLVATLPDAWLGETIAAVADTPGMTLVRVAREEEAVGICAGAFLGGRRAAVLAQNAGFLLSTNALAGLALHHHIPVLMLLAHRGDADDDQFFQSYKGRVTIPVLDALGFPWHHLQGRDDMHLIGGAARQARLARCPVAVLMSGRLLRGEA